MSSQTGAMYTLGDDFMVIFTTSLLHKILIYPFKPPQSK